MRRIFTCILLVMLTNLNSFGQTDSSFKQADHFKTKKFDVAIFPESYSDQLYVRRFTPTRKQIEKAEVDLKKNFKSLIKEEVNRRLFSILHKRLEKYKRQYFGYLDENGDEILLINCFPADDQDDSKKWLTDRVSVFDGGMDYWRIKFNLSKRLLFALNINGHA